MAPWVATLMGAHMSSRVMSASVKVFVRCGFGCAWLKLLYSHVARSPEGITKSQHHFCATKFLYNEAHSVVH